MTSSPPPSSSARRPAIKSAARVDGASTVTEWPIARSSCARPATCSLTSWGRDHANGVTRQTRRPIGPESSPVASSGCLGRLLDALASVLADEVLGQVACLDVGVLLGRRLHQVGA